MSKSKMWLVTQSLETRRLGPSEKAEKYIQDVLELGSNVGLTENELRAALIRGLTPRLKAQLVTHNPQTLAETIERIYLSETALAMTPDAVNMIESVTGCQLANIIASINKLEDRIGELAKMNKSEGKWNGTPTNQDNTRYNYTYQGSRVNQRQFPQRQYHQQTYSTRDRREEKPIQCYHCGGWGHIARNCYHRQQRTPRDTRGMVYNPRQHNYYGNVEVQRSPKNYYPRQQV